MAREAGLLRLGAVCIDGTRMAGAGSATAVRTLEEIERELETLSSELLEKAEAVDASDSDAQGNASFLKNCGFFGFAVRGFWK